jgi:hypothetical protein
MRYIQELVALRGAELIFPLWVIVCSSDYTCTCRKTAVIVRFLHVEKRGTVQDHKAVFFSYSLLGVVVM